MDECHTIDHGSGDDQERGPDTPDVSPFGDVGQRIYLYAASCAALQRWSGEVGFRVVHVGVASDPLQRVASLRELRHANLSYFVRPFERDLDDGDWWCVPVSPTRIGDGELPAGCYAWGGTVALDLQPGVEASDLARRLALLMRPLEAQSCAQLPSVMEAYALQSMFPPVMPRYSEAPHGRFLAQDIYKVSDAGDWDYLRSSLRATLATFGAGREVVDLLVETLSSAPGAKEVRSVSF